MAEKKVSVRLVAENGQQVRAEFAGLGRDGKLAFDQIGAAQKSAAASAEVFTTAIDAEIAKFQQLRASLDPLYASSKRYEAAVEQVSSALRQGIITQTEANRTLQLAEQRYLGLSNAQARAASTSRVHSSSIVNMGFQIQDFAVQVASGQSAMIAFAQQAPQFLGAFGFTGSIAMIGAGLGTLIAVGMAVAPMFMDLGAKAKTFDDRMGELDETIGRLTTNLGRVRNADLDHEFGNMTSEVRELSQALVELDRAAELKTLRDTLKSVMDAPLRSSIWERVTTPLNQVEAGGDRRSFNERLEPLRYAELTGGRGLGYDDFMSRRSTLVAQAEAGEVEAVASGVRDLMRDMKADQPFTSLNADLQTMLGNLAEAVIKTASWEAELNKTAQASQVWSGIVEATREKFREAVERVEALRKTTEAAALAEQQKLTLVQAEAAHGRESQQYAAARAAIDRENLAIRLEASGIAASEAGSILAIHDQTVATQTATLNWQTAMAGVKSEISAILGLFSQIGAGVLSNAAKTVEIEALRSGKTAAEAANSARVYQINQTYDAQKAGAANWFEGMLIEGQRFSELRGVQLDAELAAERSALAERDRLAKSETKSGARAAQRERNELLRDAERVYTSTRTAAETYRIELERLNQLRDAGMFGKLGGEDTYNRAVKELGEDFREAEERANKARTAFGATFSSIVRDSKTAGDALSRMLDQWADKLATTAGNSIFDWLFGGVAATGSSGGLISRGLSWLGFAEGGYTGMLPADAVAGVVHGGEYVFSKAATDRIGVGALDGLHQTAKKGYADGGYVGEMVSRRGQTLLDSGMGGTSRIEVSLSPELVGQIIEQAGAQSVQITRRAQTASDNALPSRLKAVNQNPRRRKS